MKKPHAYGYCRLSVDSEGSVSIDNQRRQIKEYAAAHLPGVPLSILVDRGVSGGSPLLSRPDGGRLADVRRGDHVIVAKVDRMFRSVCDGAAVIEQMDRAGVALHFLDLQIDTSTAMGRMMLQVVMAFAEAERSRCCERRREAAQHRRQAGQIMHTRDDSPPIGWRIVNDRRGRRYVADPADQRLCRKLLRLNEQGVGHRRLVAMAINKGWENRKPRGWNKSTVRRMLWAARNDFPLQSLAVVEGPLAGRYRKRTH